MKTTWFFGDSFVYGWGCKDKTNDKNKIMSQIVSECLNSEENNLAQYGYSNENIIFSIIRNINNIKKDDYVIIFDTHSARGPFVIDELDYYSEWPDNSYFEIPRSESDVYYSFRYDLSSELLTYYQSIYNNLVHHFNSIGIHCYYFPSENNWWRDKRIDSNSEENGGHWSFKGHTQVAEWVINTILHQKII
jgi:hypothetical protein